MPVKKKNFEELQQYDYLDEEIIEQKKNVYSKTIGLFLIEFSSLENTVNQSIAEFISDRDHTSGYQILELLSMRNKIELLSRFWTTWITMWKPKLRKRSQRLIKSLKEINTFRNKVVHANWMSLGKDGTVRTRIVIGNEEGDVRFERTEMPLKLIKHQTIETHNLALEVYELDEEVWQL